MSELGIFIDESGVIDFKNTNRENNMEKIACESDC